jgi:hypothetical protein
VTDEVKQLNEFRNLRLTLNNLVGKEWLLVYMDDEGQPTYVPNVNLPAEDTVFLAEMVKHIIFRQAMIYSPE